MKPLVKQLRKEFQALVKRGVLVSDDRCAKCRKHRDEFDRPLELHHKRAIKDVEPHSSFNPNVQSNLVTLCHDCHKGYHVSYEDMDMDDFLTGPLLDEVYSKLQAYRDEKQRSRESHKRKHGKI